MAMNITNVEGVYLLPRLWIYPICMNGINLIYPTFFFLIIYLHGAHTLGYVNLKTYIHPYP